MKELMKTTKGKAIAGAVCAVVIVGVILAVVLKKDGYRSISVEDVKGTVNVVGERNNGQAYKGQRLYSGDDVTVMEASELVMCADNEKYVYADENTHFVLEASSPKESSRIKIKIDKGSELNVLNAKLGVDDSYEVDTPNSTMSVRGTTFRVTVYMGNDGFVYTLLEVTEGRVLCQLKTRTGEYNGVEKEFGPGESALIRGNDDLSEFVVGEEGQEVRILDYDNLPKANVPRLIALLRKSGVEVNDPQYPEGDEAQNDDASANTTNSNEDTTTANNTSGTDNDEAKPTDHVHTPGDMKTVKEPTCTTEGLKQQKCKDCGEVIKEEKIPAKGHVADEMKIVKDATCTEAGSKQQVCTVCGTVLATEVIPAKGHVPGDWTTTQEAGCEEPGTKQRFCTVCKAVVEIGDIPAAGHNWETSRTEPTCTSAGSETTTCSRCGASTTTTLSAKGHSYREVSRTLIQLPGATSVNYNVLYECSECGDQYSTIE